MKIIRLGYYKKSRVAYVQANIWERFFINRKIKKRNSGVFVANPFALATWILKIQFMIVPRSTKGHGLFSDEEKSEYYRN